MKKFASLLLAAAMVLSLAACGNGGSSSSGSSSAAPAGGSSSEVMTEAAGTEKADEAEAPKWDQPAEFEKAMATMDLSDVVEGVEEASFTMIAGFRGMRRASSRTA